MTLGVHNHSDLDLVLIVDFQIVCWCKESGKAAPPTIGAIHICVPRGIQEREPGETPVEPEGEESALAKKLEIAGVRPGAGGDAGVTGKTTDPGSGR